MTEVELIYNVQITEIILCDKDDPVLPSDEEYKQILKDFFEKRVGVDDALVTKVQTHMRKVKEDRA